MTLHFFLVGGFIPGKCSLEIGEARDLVSEKYDFDFFAIIFTTLIAGVIKKETLLGQFDHGDFSGIVRFY